VWSKGIVEREGERFHEQVALYGPEIAARNDARAFPDRLGLTMAIGLWLSAFWVWLGTRQFATAIASAAASLATQCAVLCVLWLMGQPVGAAHLPAFLLVGAAATMASARSCRAVELRHPIYAGGVLLLAVCEVSGGLVLLASAEPAWRDVGLVVALGCAAAAGIGLFAAPGLSLALRRIGGRRADDHDHDHDHDGGKP
jgi:hypothetical protein